MDFEPDSDEETVVVVVHLVVLAPPEIPLLSREVFIAESIESYRTYKNACNMLPWAQMYPDPKYKIGFQGRVGRNLCTTWNWHQSGRLSTR
jgi:hypothetical protein